MADQRENVPLSRRGKRKLKNIQEALRDGKVCLVAQLNSEEVIVPLELLRGTWILVRSHQNEANSYLVATDPTLQTEIGPRYYNPIFAPPLQ